jgi:hypothetical protein
MVMLKDLSAFVGFPKDFRTLVKATPLHLKLINQGLTGSGRESPTKALMVGGEALVPGALQCGSGVFRRFD